MIDWQALIDEQVDLHNQLEALGYYGVDDPTLLGPPATEEQITAAEARLNVRLDPEYRSFLAVANGWREQQDFWNLLSTEELGIGANYIGAGLPKEYRKNSVLPWTSIMDNLAASWGLRTNLEKRPPELPDWKYLIPIGVTEGLGGDLYMIGTPLDQTATEPKPLYETINQPPLRYSSFSDYLRASIQRDRDRIARATT